MEGVNSELLDPVLLKRILLTAIGLFSCFMGLWIYKSTVQGVGFLVGLGCAAYLVFVVFTQYETVIDLSNIQFLVLIVGILVIGGLIGAYLSRAFEYIIFFLAGGIIALVLSRLWAGDVIVQDLSTFEKFRDALTGAPPKNWEILIFFIGGFLYMLNIGPIVALTTAALGAFCIRWAWFDVFAGFGEASPNLVAILFVVVGTTVQLLAFRRKMEMIPPKFRRRGFL
jgi:hypothetical protein